MNNTGLKLNGRLCYGYQKDKNGCVCIDEHKAEIVKNIFDRYKEGYSLGGIVEWLNDNHIPSPSGKKKWTRAAIDKILSNKSYAPHILNILDFMNIQLLKCERSNMERDDNWDKVRKSTRYDSKKVLRNNMR